MANNNLSDLDHVKELNVAPVEREAFAPWAVFMMVMILPFLSMIAYLISSNITSGYISDVDKEFMQHMRLETRGKADALAVWLDRSSKISNRITKSRTIQSYIVNANEKSAPDGTLEPIVKKQLPYIEEVLTTFARQNNIFGAHLINRRAKSFAKSAEAMALPDGYDSISRDVFTSQRTQFGGARMNGEIMVIDMFMPIKALQKRMGAEARSVVGVLIMSIPLGDELRRIFKPSPLSLDGQSMHVFQKKEKSYSLLTFTGDAQGIFTQDATHRDKNYKGLWKLFGFKNEGKHDLKKIPQFGQKGILPRSGEIIMIKEDVDDSPYIIMTIIGLKDAYKDVLMFRRQAQIIAQLIAFTIFILFLSFWWRHQEARQRVVTELYQTFASTVNTQRNLLVNINNAVKEHITLKYFDGHYIYVNPAFAKMLGMKHKEVLGKTDKELFNENAAEQFAAMDKRLLKDKKTVYEELSLIINDKRCYFEVSKSPFRDSSNHFAGVITVSRDITDVVEERVLKEKALKNSMRALTRIMERHDLHLVKHARYLTHIVKALSTKMQLKDKDLMTLDICANLCQVGMVFVPQDVLKTPVAEMNDHMLTAYQSHIEDSAYILDTVDWGLPIVITTYSMHERLDGSGYPSKTTDEDISQLARILGVCDKFCALTAPRRGEKVYTPEEAIKWMVNEKGVFDLRVIQALAELIAEKEEILMVS